MAKATAVKQPMTKAQLLSAIVEDTGLTRRQVTDVVDSLGGQIQRHIKKRGPGTFTLPGLLKIRTNAQAGQEGPPGHQSIYGRRDDVRREARAHRGEDPAPEGVEGHGGLTVAGCSCMCVRSFRGTADDSGTFGYSLLLQEDNFLSLTNPAIPDRHHRRSLVFRNATGVREGTPGDFRPHRDMSKSNVRVPNRSWPTESFQGLRIVPNPA